MIGYLEGIAKKCEEGRIIIVCRGVGYEIFWTGHEIKEGESIKAWIHEHRGERDVRLFGFDTNEGKKIFRKLIKVKGIGPTTAYNILRSLKPNQVLKAIEDEDLYRLSSIEGVGRKTAVRIINELKGTFKIFPETGSYEKEDELESALVGLGYNIDDVRKVLAEIKKTGGSLDDYNELIKRAIKMLKS